MKLPLTSEAKAEACLVLALLRLPICLVSVSTTGNTPGTSLQIIGRTCAVGYGAAPRVESPSSLRRCEGAESAGTLEGIEGNAHIAFALNTSTAVIRRCPDFRICSHHRRIIGSVTASAATAASGHFVTTAKVVMMFASLVVVKAKHVAHRDERELDTHTHDLEDGDVQRGLTIVAIVVTRGCKG